MSAGSLPLDGTVEVRVRADGYPAVGIPLMVAMLLGCTSEGPSPPPPDAGTAADAATPTDGGTLDAATPVPPSAGQLLIEELYYAGAVPAGGADHYFSDQFVELVNASGVRLDLSGVLLGEVFGVAGEINPGTAPDGFRDSHPDEVVLSTVWRIPAQVVLEPDGRLVVAHDGTNHRPFSTIDLSGADLEAYVADSGGDEDSPTVDNLELVHFTGGYDWLLTVFGPSVVVLDASVELGELEGPFGPLQTAPASAVIDAIETLMDGDSGDYRRLPAVVSTGHAWVSGTYTGESLHRRRTGDRWQDTDDSGADFEIGAPDPGLPAEHQDVTGEPWIELGTGLTSYEALADGGQLELVAGPQGGWHVEVTSRIGGFGPDGVLLVYDALDATGEPISYVTQTILRSASVIARGDAFERVGDRVVLAISNPAEVVGTEVVVRVTAALADLRASDERAVTIVDERP